MKDLSPFHQEIFSFLQSKCAGSTPFLDEIAETYRRSYDPIEPSSVEVDWMRAFSESEFTSLGMKEFFPRIYRGLPRLYNRDDPSRVRLKKHFASLSALKNLSVDRALFSLYDRFSPKVGAKVGILTWVMSDGLGDWMAAQEAARILKARFPGLEIHLFAIPQKGTLPPADFPVHVICYEGEMHTKLDIEFGMDYLLQIPTYFPNSKKVLHTIPMDCIGEYGFLDSCWFHPEASNSWSMGLHALEQGIFIRRHKEVPFTEVENKALLQSLFGTEMPGPFEISVYHLKSRFHLAYLATPIGGAIYLHSLLKMWKRDEKDIDICSPDIGWLIQWMESRQNLSLLQEPFGVRAIRIEWEGKIHEIKLGEKGKLVRIISPGILSFADMQRLISLSGDWVGVRGNQSLSEAISAGKAFFYDGREHSRHLVKDLLAMAENRLSGYKSALHAFRMMGQAFLWNLPEELEEWVDETHFQQENRKDWFEIAIEIGLSLQDPDAIAGFRKFGRICSEERSFAPFLCNLLQRNLMHLTHPGLKEEEASLRRQYGAGEISFTPLVNQLMQKIRQIH